MIPDIPGAPGLDRVLSHGGRPADGGLCLGDAFGKDGKVAVVAVIEPDRAVRARPILTPDLVSRREDERGKNREPNEAPVAGRSCRSGLRPRFFQVEAKSKQQNRVQKMEPAFSIHGSHTNTDREQHPGDAGQAPALQQIASVEGTAVEQPPDQGEEDEHNERNDDIVDGLRKDRFVGEHPQSSFPRANLAN